ncbi:DEAD/DEAH box helicase [Arcanobacterium phocae]|uniref:DEAD/DEAH box helicase n=1 Tax=Arcanobacterium phocae TaxID=131112 RepID=UPI001C0EFE9B|nr:DEAD/DEAH box helicase [Arcanobacterium phocae]
MKYSPHDYQAQAVKFILEHPTAAVFLGMGLGKTVITLTALQILEGQGKTRRALIIAPKRVAESTWPAEIEKWDHINLDYQVAVGNKAQRAQAVDSDATVTIINRENLPWLYQHLGGKWPYDTVIIDELSSFKSHSSQRVKIMVKARRHIERIVGLTGTPASNGLMDLFAQFRVLDDGQRLGKYITHFRNDFFDPDKRSAYQIFTWKPKPDGEKRIYDAIADVTMSMQTTDFLTLPELIMQSVVVEMSEAEKKTYTDLKNDMVATIDDDVIDAGSAGVLALKLQQLANGAIYNDATATKYTVLHDRKLDALEDLHESANGHSLLVAYWFKHDADRIEERFPGVREIRTSEDIADWNAGRIDMALIHPASAGHGLNLQTGGHLMVWFGLTWSLELYQQANARLFRQGQCEPVTVTHIVTAGSVDERILAALEKKDLTQSALLDAVRAELTVEEVVGVGS